MAKFVNVSLLHPMTLRLGDKEYQYSAGMRTMPYEHARALRVLRRIRGEVLEPEAAQTTAGDPAFVGLSTVFDAPLAEILTKAGYANLAELNTASHDELLALEGIGPARFEEIQAALGRRLSTEDEGE